jgi:phosphatidate cytidylyltransferase
MALNLQTFRVRTITSIVFVVVMLVGLLWNQWSFFLLFSVIHFGCWIEYQKLVSRISPDFNKITPVHHYGVMIAGWFMMLYFTNSQLQLFGFYLSVLGFWLGLTMVLVLPLVIVINSRFITVKNLLYSAFGLVYISLSIALLIDLRNSWEDDQNGLSLVIPLLLIFTLWVNDTMAYIVGSWIGKTPLSAISPKKTWEGTVGGLILAVIVMCIAAFYTEKLSLINTAMIALLVGVAGTYGDLFESKLKRLAGEKDSGTLLPGHGGFLDRFDSLLFASIVVWLFSYFFIKPL